MKDKVANTNLPKLLATYFNLAELQDLCFEMGFNFEELPNTQGELSKNAIALITKLHREDRLPEFVALCRKKRPLIAWPDAPTMLFLEGDIQAEAKLQEALDEYKKYIRGKWGRDSLLDGPLADFYILLEGQEPEEKKLKEASPFSETSKDSLPESFSEDSEASKQNQDKKETPYVSYRPPPLVLQEALEKHKRLIVLGTAGTGKSTFLRRLAYQKTQNNGNTVPILVSLADFAKAIENSQSGSKTGLRQWAIEAAHEDPTIQAILNRAVKENQVLWLLDGFDETGNQMNKVADAIAKLPAKNQLVLTTRPDTHLKEHQHRFNATQYEMCDLSQPDVKQFLPKWFDDPDKTAEVLKWLADTNHPQRRELIKKPLHLVLLATIAKKTSPENFPKTRVQLYGKFIGDYLDKRLEEKKDGHGVYQLGTLKRDKAHTAAMNGFYYLGWVLFHQEKELGNNSITPEKQVVDCLEQAGHSNENAEAILSFWQEAGVQQSFHQIFWPYAAACKLYEDWKDDAENTWQFLSSATRELPYASRLHHPDWKEPILMLTALMDKPQNQLNEFMGRLLSKPDKEERYLHQKLRLAAAILGEVGAGKISKPHEQRIVRQLGQLARDYPKFVVALLAAGPIAIPELEHTFNTLSREVLKVLGEMGAKESVPLLTRIMNEDVSSAGLAAADALSKIDHETATEALIKQLEKNEYIVARDGVSNWYHFVPPFIKSKTAVLPLIRTLENKNPRENGVQRLAAITLGEIGDKRAIPALVAALDNDRSDFVSEPAAKALVQIGPDAIPYLFKAVEALGNEPEHDKGRYTIALTLVELGDFRVIHHLMPYLKKCDGDVVRNTIRKVLVQLGKIKGEVAIHQYLQICKLKPSDETTQLAFLNVLEELSLPRIILDLIRLSHSTLRYFLLEAVEDLQVTMTGIENDIICVANDDMWSNIRIIRILGELRSATSVPKLLDILNNNQHLCEEIANNRTNYEYIRTLAKDFISWEIEKAAIQSLGKIKADTAVPALTHILTFNDKEVRDAIKIAFQGESIFNTVGTSVYFDNLHNLRREAAVALREIGNVSTLDMIRNVATNKNHAGREEAIYALGQIGDVKAVPYLIEVLTTVDDNYPWKEDDLWKITASALGHIGDARAIPRLITLAQKSSSDDVRSVALKALKQIDIDTAHEETISSLVVALGNWQKEIHQTIADKLTQMGSSIAPLLREILEKSNNSQIRCQIMQILAKIGDWEAIPLFVKALENNDKHVSQVAVQALSKMGRVSDKDFKKLIAIFDDRQKSYLYSEITVAIGQLAASIADVELSSDRSDTQETLESARKSLWQRRFVPYKKEVFTAYEQIKTQLTKIQVRQLSPEPCSGLSTKPDSPVQPKIPT